MPRPSRVLCERAGILTLDLNVALRALTLLLTLACVMQTSFAPRKSLKIRSRRQEADRARNFLRTMLPSATETIVAARCLSGSANGILEAARNAFRRQAEGDAQRRTNLYVHICISCGVWISRPAVLA
jgi:hypothetical protein